MSIFAGSAAIFPGYTNLVHITEILAFRTGSTALSLSMYLMMEHNKNSYVVFLRVLRRFRLNYCCLCGHRMVSEQLTALECQGIKKALEHPQDIPHVTDTVHSNVSQESGPRTIVREQSVDTMTVQMEHVA